MLLVQDVSLCSRCGEVHFVASSSDRQNCTGSATWRQKPDNIGQFTVNSRKADIRRNKQQAITSNNVTPQRPYSMIIPNGNEIRIDPRRTRKAAAMTGHKKEASSPGATISWSSQLNSINGSSPRAIWLKDEKGSADQISMIPRPQVQPSSPQVPPQKKSSRLTQNNKSSSITHLSDNQSGRRSSGLILDGETYNRLAMSVDNFIGKEEAYSDKAWSATNCISPQMKVNDSRQKEMITLKSPARAYDIATTDNGPSVSVSGYPLHAINQKASTLPKLQRVANIPGSYFTNCEEEDEDVCDSSLSSVKQRTFPDLDKVSGTKPCGASLIYLPTSRSCANDPKFENTQPYGQNFQRMRDKHSDFYKSTPDMRPLGRITPKPTNVPHPPAQSNQYQLQDFANRYEALTGSMIDGLLEEENEDDTESDFCESSPPLPPPISSRGTPVFFTPRQPSITTSPQFGIPPNVQIRRDRRSDAMFRSQIYDPHHWDGAAVPIHAWSPVNPEYGMHPTEYNIASHKPVVRMTGSLGRRQGIMINSGLFGQLSPRDTSRSSHLGQRSSERVEADTYEMTRTNCAQPKNAFQERTIAVGYFQPPTERSIQAENDVNRPTDNNRRSIRLSRGCVSRPTSDLYETPMLEEKPIYAHSTKYGFDDDYHFPSLVSTGPHSFEHLHSNPHTRLHDDEMKFRRSPCPPSSFLARSPKPTIQYTQQPRSQKASHFPNKARSELELRSVKCMSDPLDLHPDSYIRGRPNFRFGFGGNYSRPDAGIQKSESKYTRSISLERPQIHSPNSSGVPKRPTVNDHSSNTSGDEPSHGKDHKNLPCIVHSRYASNDQTSPNLSSSCDLNSTYLKSPSMIWTDRTDKEKKLDDRLSRLIGQLPKDKQNAVGIILMKMGIRSYTEQCENKEGLVFRLMEALQLPLPHIAMNGNYQHTECHCGTRICVSPGVRSMNSPIKTESKSGPNLIGDTRMTQSCYQALESRDSVIDFPTLGRNSTATLNGYSRGSPTTASSTSIDSNSDVEPTSSLSSSARIKSSPDNGPCGAPTCSTVLRRLARCIAVRISYKRQHLAEANQCVARNETEEKWLRDKLNELFTMNGTAPPAPWSICSRCDSSFTVTETFDTPTAQVVTRFDRWHNNILSVLQLLCQLARRLAWTDAQLVSLDRRNAAANHSFRSIEALNRLSNLQPTKEMLKNQKEALQAKITEAQELRAGLETCRVRLLENIPPGLKVEDTGAMKLPGNEQSISPDGDRVNGSLSQSLSDTPQVRQSVTLRERITVHLNNTLRWLITSQILDTDIRVDQQLHDAIQDELRYGMS